jgi:hypothetical protein
MSDLITLPRAVVRQALEALEKCSAQLTRLGYSANHADQVIPTVRAALEQTVQEPVAWCDIEEDGTIHGLRYWSEPGRREHALYTHPPRREPLSDEELDRLWREPMSADWEHREYARAVEAAHGIKEKLKELNT